MKIVLTGGCTGGHIYPALAIGDKFIEKDQANEVIYIASGAPLERSIIPDHGYKLYEVESEPLDRSDIKKIIRTISLTLKGRRQSLHIMKDFKPDVVVSTGSFVSVPVVLAAHSLGASIYLHEQNGFPGISNRFLARFARKVFLGFDAAREYLKCKDKLVYSGNPVRSDFSGRSREDDRASLGIDQENFVIMVFGGSLGALTTNEVGMELARRYAGVKGYEIIWGSGSGYYDEVKKRLEDEGLEADNIRLSAYIKDMPRILSACNLIISRSGALSTAETTMAGRAAIFIPSPNVTADHQYYNAKAVTDCGGGFIVRESDNTPLDVCRIVEELDADRDRIDAMEAASRSVAPVNATDIIYDVIMETYKK